MDLVCLAVLIGFFGLAAALVHRMAARGES